MEQRSLLNFKQDYYIAKDTTEQIRDLFHNKTYAVVIIIPLIIICIKPQTNGFKSWQNSSTVVHKQGVRQDQN